MHGLEMPRHRPAAGDMGRIRACAILALLTLVLPLGARTSAPAHPLTP